MDNVSVFAEWGRVVKEVGNGAAVVAADGGTWRILRRVRNLGWLLRHWQDVDRMAVLVHDCSKYPRAIMVALLRDGNRYVTEWASAGVLAEWLDRPVFRGLRVDWWPADGDPERFEAGAALAKAHGTGR